jgi:hypothetical protein
LFAREVDELKFEVAVAVEKEAEDKGAAKRRETLKWDRTPRAEMFRREAAIMGHTHTYTPPANSTAAIISKNHAHVAAIGAIVSFLFFFLQHGTCRSDETWAQPR